MEYILINCKVYNNSLMINSDCRTKDALEYMKREFREITRLHPDDVDTWLETQFNGKAAAVIIMI